MCARPSAPPPSSATPTAGAARRLNSGQRRAGRQTGLSARDPAPRRRSRADWRQEGSRQISSARVHPLMKTILQDNAIEGNCSDGGQNCYRVVVDGLLESGRRRKKALPGKESPSASQARRSRAGERRWSYFGGGAGVNPSRLWAGSGLGFGLGAFLTSFLPLSLLPMEQVCHKDAA